MAQRVSDHRSTMRSFNATSVFNAHPKLDLTTGPAVPTAESIHNITAATNQPWAFTLPHLEFLTTRGVLGL
jgi:hypothetical protein